MSRLLAADGPVAVVLLVLTVSALAVVGGYLLGQLLAWAAMP